MNRRLAILYIAVVMASLALAYLALTPGRYGMVSW
jgi:hypothetical protein